MATDIGKLQKRKYIIWIHSLKKRCIKRQFTGIHDRFLRDSDFRKSMLEHDRDEDVCLAWDDLAEQDFHLSNDRIRIFSKQTKLVDLSQ